MCLLDLRLPFPAINHQANEGTKCHCKNKFNIQATISPAKNQCFSSPYNPSVSYKTHLAMNLLSFN